MKVTRAGSDECCVEFIMKMKISRFDIIETQTNGRMMPYAEEPKVEVARRRPEMPESIETSVFVVDKERLFQRQMENILAENGFALSCFEQPERALEALVVARKNPNVIIIGTQSSDIGGMSLVRHIRSYRPPHAPSIVIATTEPTYELAIAALRLGVVDILKKPASPGEIAAVVDRAYQIHLDYVLQNSHFREAGVIETFDLGKIGPDKREQTKSAEIRMRDLLELLDLMSRRGSSGNLDFQEIQMLADIAVSAEGGRKTTVTGLAYGLRLPLATIHRKVKHLETLRLIERSFDESDRRLSYLALTEQGEDVLANFLTEVRMRYRVVQDRRDARRTEGIAV